MSETIALPRLRARRRRLPRPPKFTRLLKALLLGECLLGAAYLAGFLVGDDPLISLFGVAGAVTGVRATFFLALKQVPAARQANTLALACYGVAFVGGLAT